ncbi:unnamed protein product [Ilex paraguariensis]|uniref:Gnk2-homologous domain-containing protein n=1 Tax=Ilex paraguariensis TaxID=185542 RepID=A0ABC8QRW0_9AQUA
MLLLKDPKSYALFVMISIIGFGQIFCVHGQALSHGCSNDTANSSYIDDRTSLLDSLSSRATSMDFYNETFNDIHGLFLCRGDVNASTCRNCVTGAGEEIIRVCQPNRAAIIWYDFCMIRYSDINFFGELQSGQVVLVYNTQHVNSTEDPQNFAAVNFIQVLILDSLITENLYTANSLPLPNGDQVRYGMVQCTRDITNSTCRDCLEMLVQIIPPGRVGWRILGNSCNIRYEQYPFFLQSTAAPPPTPVPPPPPSTPAPPTDQGESKCLAGNGGLKNTTKIAVITVSTAAGVAVLGLCVYICLCSKRELKG